MAWQRAWTLLLAAALPALACTDRPVPPGCEPAACPQGACGEHPDGCGDVLECGPCDGGEPDGGQADGGPDGGAPDGGCVGETDKELCRAAEAGCGALWANDRCGESRRLDCGPCGDGGGCVGESDAELCAAAGIDCGPFEAVDRCDEPREADCGPCDAPDAGTPDGGGCPTACAPGWCGDHPNGCGLTLRCGDCAAPGTCGLREPGVCGCDALTCASAGRACGELYDGCGRMLDCGACPAGTSAPPTRLRIAAANLTSGNLQSWDPGHGVRILQGLAPDVVLIQEFNYGNKTAADIRRLVVTMLGARFYHARGYGSIPNGVISRYPIVASGRWADPRVGNRDFTWARIDLPGPRDLWAVSLHLLTSSSGDRSAEATALATLLRQNVPAVDFLAVGGDLNTSTRTEGALQNLRTLVVTTAPWPVDQDGAGGTSASRSEPYDWVLVDPDLNALRAPVTLGSLEFPAGLVLDTRVFRPLSLVAPAREDDSDAPNMQHMAVVKDFLVP